MKFKIIHLIIYPLIFTFGIGSNIVLNNATLKNENETNSIYEFEIKKFKTQLYKQRSQAEALANQMSNLEFKLASMDENIKTIQTDAQHEQSSSIEPTVIDNEPEGKLAIQETADNFSTSTPEDPKTTLITQVTTEEVDTNWAYETQKQFETAMYENPMEGITLGTVDCRSSICEINYSFDQEVDNLDEKLAVLMMNSPLNGEQYFEISEEDRTLSLFVAREGHELSKSKL